MRCHDEWRDEAALSRQVLAVQTERNAQRRVKLERLYPVKEPEAT
jgi:hypothetical protein